MNFNDHIDWISNLIGLTTLDQNSKLVLFGRNDSLEPKNITKNIYGKEYFLKQILEYNGQYKLQITNAAFPIDAERRIEENATKLINVMIDIDFNFAENTPNENIEILENIVQKMILDFKDREMFPYYHLSGNKGIHLILPVYLDLQNGQKAEIKAVITQFYKYLQKTYLSNDLAKKFNVAIDNLKPFTSLLTIPYTIHPETKRPIVPFKSFRDGYDFALDERLYKSNWSTITKLSKLAPKQKTFDYEDFDDSLIIPLKNPDAYKELLFDLINPFLIKGQRHNLIYALSGLLRRCGFDEQWIISFFESFQVRDISIEARETVKDVFKRKQKIPGYPWIKNTIKQPDLLISSLHKLLDSIDSKKKLTLEDLDFTKKYDSLQEAFEIIKEPIKNIWNETPVKENQAKCINAIARTIIANDFFITIKNTKIDYHYEDGVYILGSESIIEEYAEEILAEKCDNKTVNEILGKVRRLTYRDETIFDMDPNFICVKNGILNIMTKELVPHSPDYYFLQKIPIEFNPHAQAPVFQKYLEDVMPGTSRENDKKSLIQFLGYCLFRAYPVAQFIILNGSGHNGKTVYLELASEFVGQYISTVGLENLSEKDASSEMVGKLLNRTGELGEVKIKDLKLIKEITGNDKVRVRYLFKGGFTTKLYTKFLFANNKLPKFNDQDDAIFRRILIIEFNEIFEEGDVKTDPNLLNKLTEPNEMSGILNLSLIGLEELLQLKHFSCYTNVEDNRNRLLPKLNPVAGWIEKEVEFIPTEKELGKNCFTSFTIYCSENNYTTGSRNEFYATLGMLCGPKIQKGDSNKGVQFTGLKLKNVLPPTILPSNNSNKTLLDY